MGLADLDYLAARLLILSALPTIGLAKAAEAIEKQFKLCFIIYEKIQNDHEVTVRELKNFGHSLSDMLESFNTIAPESAALSDEWKDYLILLQDSYDRRYPEHWQNWEVPVSIDHLDQLYTYMRNLNVNNMPQELKQRSMDFGTFLGDLWNERNISRVRSNGLMEPMALLQLRNNFFEVLEIEKP